MYPWVFLMRTATELTPAQGLTRRQCMLLGAWLASPLAAQAHSSGQRLWAAWQEGTTQKLGRIAFGQHASQVLHALDVPTRAHGLWAELHSDSVLAVARRPGEWLLRWHPVSGQTQWHWVEDDRRFNGHMVVRADGQTLWTTETDLEDAGGLLAVRDVRSLEKTAEWPTHGRDPHQVLALPQACGPWPKGTLLVANGGIPTLPETGRSKRQLGKMDASLSALHPVTGELLGQWRLTDRFLSIRHLAWDPVSRSLGIALQAEHPASDEQALAPVLAIWNGHGLQAARGQPAMAGYGGDIIALPQGGFAVSCPRVNAVSLFDAEGVWKSMLPFAGAYALGRSGKQRWVGGSPDVLLASEPVKVPAPEQSERWLRDNHWAADAS